jgi:arabinofuranosyltransferase
MVGVGGWLHRWTDEDAFINFRIVDQLMAGHGPVFNAGERVETYTSALWLALLAVGRTTLGLFMGPEWTSVLLGLAAAVAAFAVAARASRRLGESGRLGEPGRLFVPIGLVAAAAIPVVWDFATSGLEMGLVWLWIAGSWAVLSHVVHQATPSRRVRRWSLVLLGLGPLVRPELGLMSATFLLAWFVLVRPRHIARDLAVALALPLAYQVFRMGYFASLVPSTALAKDSGGLHLGQGWAYFTDLVGAYGLWIPALAGIAAIALVTTARRDRRVAVAVGAMLVAAGLDLAYIVATGGDYMHGRLLLPAVFAAAAPVFVTLPDSGSRLRRGLAVIATAAVVVWSGVVVAAVRYPAPSLAFGLTDIADWRQVLHGQMFHHPGKGITISPYALRAAYERGTRGFMRITDTAPRPGKDPHRLAVMMGSIGVPAWIAGRNVYIVDIGGLAEPLAARTAPIADRPAGHRKQVDDQWYWARFGRGDRGPRVDAARRVLRCEPVRGLLDSVDRPLTPGRFLSNLWHAAPYTFVHIPRDPIDAEREFC